MSPAEFIAVLGVITTLGGWLAGRNRYLTRALNDLTTRYRDLVADLGAEIDRLHIKIMDLEQTIRSMRNTAG